MLAEIVRKFIICCVVAAVAWLGGQGLASADSQAATPKTKLIVFVHGFTGDQGSWSKFAKLVREDATLGDFKVYTMEYPASTFWETTSIRQVGELLRTELVERFSTYSEVYLIGHSMGGLVICSMVIEQLTVGRARDLKRIKHIMLFATPNNGTQIPKLFGWYNTQLADLSSTGQTVDDIRNEWVNRGYNPKITPGDENYKLQIPVTVVVGLEDRFVDEASAKSFFRDPPPVTVPGDHKSMKEPDNRDSLAYVIVKNKLLSSKDIQPQSTFQPNELRDGIPQVKKSEKAVPDVSVVAQPSLSITCEQSLVGLTTKPKKFVPEWIPFLNLLRDEKIIHDFQTLMEIRPRLRKYGGGPEEFRQANFTLDCLEKNGYLKTETLDTPSMIGGEFKNRKIFLPKPIPTLAILE